MKSAVSVVDPDEEPLTRKQVLNHKIRTPIAVHVKSRHRKSAQVGREADSSDTMRSDMNFYPEAFVLADKERAISVFVVIEIGGSNRWAKQVIRRDPEGFETYRSILLVH
jgi:hypothetical protein